MGGTLPRRCRYLLPPPSHPLRSPSEAIRQSSRGGRWRQGFSRQLPLRFSAPLGRRLHLAAPRPGGVARGSYCDVNNVIPRHVHKSQGSWSTLPILQFGSGPSGGGGSTQRARLWLLNDIFACRLSSSETLGKVTDLIRPSLFLWIL